MDKITIERQMLLPCPFCGANAEILTIPEDHPDAGAMFVQCCDSRCMTSSALLYPLMDDVRALLVERWNRRAALAAQPADPIAARSRYETAYAGHQLPHTQTTTSEPVQRQKYVAKEAVMGWLYESQLRAEREAAQPAEPVAWINRRVIYDPATDSVTGYGEPELSFERASYGYDYANAKPLVLAQPAPAAVPSEGEIVVSKNEAGQIVCVSRQDEDGQFLSIIAESADAVPLTDEQAAFETWLSTYPASGAGQPGVQARGGDDNCADPRII